MTAVPRSRSTDKRFYGVVEGLVTHNADPDHEGKVRVQFPWFDDNTITEWCRVMQPYAGSGYGMFFVPEVGDEVVVAFAHGDMRLPIILGGVFNGQDKPPTHRDDSTDQKLIRTKGGHQMLLDDTDGQHAIKIITSGGHTVGLDDAGHAVKVTTSGGQTIDLDDGGGTIKVSTSGGSSVTLDGTGVTISATSVTIAATSISLGQAAASSLVLGEAFMALFNAHVHPGTTPSTGPPVTPMTPAMLSLTTKTS